MELKIIPWNQDNPPTEEMLREQLDDQELRIFRWSRPPEGVLPGHTHGYHKILYVVDGSIKFDFPTRQETFNLKAGDRLELPAGIRHTATVGGDGVSCLEAHIY